MDFILQLLPGISTFLEVEPKFAIARVLLIAFGFLLAYLGFKGTLEPLIMVPMGIGMIGVNCGTLFLPENMTTILDGATVGNIIIAPLVADPNDLVNIMQINFLQPIYNLTFSNGLIACLVFMGIGARSEISFLLAKPWSSMVIAIFAELGTFVTLILGVAAFGLLPSQAAAVATIGGADGPMVLFASLMLAPELFVPISIIAYLYLSLTYGGYPYIIKAMVPKKYRGIDMIVDVPEVSQKSKFIFILIICTLLCLLLPIAAPLILSFFVGMAVKEANIGKYTELCEEGLSYFATFFLGLLLGVLCEAGTILNETVLKILVLGIVALFISAVGGLIGGWIMYFWHKRKGEDFNPTLGIAGVSCVPTTAKLAQHAAQDENPFAIILPVAMGANISGVITSAIVAGIFVATISMVTVGG
jgi:oxaloacetate decarboxylase beta subunit